MLLFINIKCWPQNYIKHKGSKGRFADKLCFPLFFQIFSTPNHHPKSQPFYDHVFTFSISDNRIWFRNYQILEEDGSLAEIGL